MKEAVSKLKNSKAVKWHAEFLKQENQTEFSLHANIAVAMFFGHVMSPVELGILFFLVYAVGFIVFVGKEKKEDLEKPPWMEQGMEEEPEPDYKHKVDYTPMPEQAREMIRRGETMNDYVERKENECEVEGCERDWEYKVQFLEPHQPAVERKVCFTHQRMDEALKHKYGMFHTVFSDWAKEKLREDAIEKRGDNQ